MYCLVPLASLLYQSRQKMSTTFFNESENKLHVGILVPGTNETNPTNSQEKEKNQKKNKYLHT